MVWDGSAQGGFTTGTPWLPVKPPHLARNLAGQGDGSILTFYRQILTFPAPPRTPPLISEGLTPDGKLHPLGFALLPLQPA